MQRIKVGNKTWLIDNKTFGLTTIWKLGPELKEAGYRKQDRRRMSERIEVMYVKPDDELAWQSWREMTNDEMSSL